MIVFVFDVLSPMCGERYGKNLNDIRMREALYEHLADPIGRPEEKCKQ